MTNQRRMTKRQAIMLIAYVPLLALTYAGIVAPLPWAFIIAAVLFTPAVVGVILPWLVKPEDRSLNFNNICLGCTMVSLLAIFPLLKALAILHVPQRFGFDAGAALIFGIFLWMLVVFPFSFLSSRRLLEPSDEELKQAHYLIATGWGLTPEEALKSARAFIAPGIIAGIGSIGAGFVAIYFGSGLSQQPGRFVYLGFALLVLLASVPGFFFAVFKGLKFWRVGQAWREQATGTITIRGTFVDQWIEEKAGDKTLAKVKLRDGTNKVLLVGPAFEDLLPEVDEEVEIEYLFGCEAVVGVRALNGAANDAPDAEDKRDAEA